MEPCFFCCLLFKTSPQLTVSISLFRRMLQHSFAVKLRHVCGLMKLHLTFHCHKGEEMTEFIFFCKPFL